MTKLAALLAIILATPAAARERVFLPLFDAYPLKGNHMQWWSEDWYGKGRRDAAIMFWAPPVLLKGPDHTGPWEQWLYRAGWRSVQKARCR